MNKLKQISPDSIPRALEKAERYRMLNEPFFAESICLDVLQADPEHRRAQVIYLLSLTDQFRVGSMGGVPRAHAVVDKMKDEYERLYYRGIVVERGATTTLESASIGDNDAAWHGLQNAMALYTKADAVCQDPTNDDALLRYNTCVRLIERYHLTEPVPEDRTFPLE